MPGVTKPVGIKDLAFAGDLRGVYADEMLIARKNDGMCVLSWHFRLPDESAQEVARVVVSRQHVERMIDTMCHVLAYAPKPLKTEATDSKPAP